MALGHDGEVTGFAVQANGALGEKHSFEKLSSDLEGRRRAAKVLGAADLDGHTPPAQECARSSYLRAQR